MGKSSKRVRTCCLVYSPSSGCCKVSAHTCCLRGSVAGCREKEQEERIRRLFRRWKKSLGLRNRRMGVRGVGHGAGHRAQRRAVARSCPQWPPLPLQPLLMQLTRPASYPITCRCRCSSSGGHGHLGWPSSHHQARARGPSRLDVGEGGLSRQLTVLCPSPAARVRCPCSPLGGPCRGRRA